MSDLSADSPSPAGASACPACAAAPLAESLGSRAVRGGVVLSLPKIHCAACISGVERLLHETPGVRAARVNLTLKRAQVEIEEEVTSAEALTARLTEAGFEAYELDPGQLGNAEAERPARELLMRLAVAGFAMMNIMLLSVAVWSGAEAATRDMFHWISAAIAIPAVGFCGQPFFVSAWAALRGGRLNMDVPISLAILLAVGMSLYETAHSGAHAYFDAAVSLTFFLLAGRYLDFRTRASARSAAQELAALEVPRATKLVGGTEVQTAISELSVGDLIRVTPGARIPTDGVITEGVSELDRSLLTGETLPVQAHPDTVVSAGEMNLTGVLTLRVTAAGEDSSLHRMAELVAVAENARSRYTSLADKAAALYAPGVHILAAVTGLGWLLYSSDLRLSLNIASAVLIITCPCALGLAVPAVVTAASGRLFRRGLLIKSGTALERLAEVDTVVFDKTGTLTLGQPVLQNAEAIPAETMALAACLARGSAHPLAQALAAYAPSADAPGLEEIREVPGYGIEAQWQGQHLRLGRADWVGAEARDVTATWLRIGQQAPVAFEFADALRPGAAEAVEALRARGLGIKLLSGDAPAPVAQIAADLGITDWQASCRPEDKATEIATLSEAGHRVLMVGDGLNDTAALTAAHVSISPASALDAARVASDVVLLGKDLAPLGDAFETARKSTRLIRQNFSISTVYNVIAVPLAIAGLATPLAAALAMSLSSISVSLNALRVR
ncbi:heavy metal translocating P-type ATPase [Dinoroseobacter sp. S76]|uniref:heavy metal translocating P-type ATPase n=1 Tax=Dinoroseobacter sp. S76 TaxID=3415124 RepID=UPI003C7DC35B